MLPASIAYNDSGSPTITTLASHRGRLNTRSVLCRDVHAIAAKHLDKLENRILQFQAIAEALRHLAEACRGDGRPDCPILDDFSDREIHDVL